MEADFLAISYDPLRALRRTHKTSQLLCPICYDKLSRIYPLTSYFLMQGLTLLDSEALSACFQVQDWPDICVGGLWARTLQFQAHGYGLHLTHYGPSV